MAEEKNIAKAVEDKAKISDVEEVGLMFLFGFFPSGEIA